VRAIPQLILGLVLVPTVAVQIGERYASDTTVFINFVATATPTAGGATPTPTPAGAPSWSSSIDHCWNFENDLTDSCTGATAITLLAAGAISYDSGTSITGSSMAVDSGEGATANSTTELAAPASDQLTMWCWVNFTTMSFGQELMDKQVSTLGYRLATTSGSGGSNLDLYFWENNGGNIVADVFPPTPTGWVFIWWKAAAGLSASGERAGAMRGTSFSVAGSAPGSAVLTDATTETFTLGTVFSSTGAVGWYDECGWDSFSMSDESICRICSCGVDGSACACSGTTYTNSGRNTTMCGSCALPACDTAAPLGLPAQTPIPTATPTPGPTQTPLPTATPRDWSGIIDHCWNFDGNANDSCTGATPINLAVTGFPYANAGGTFVSGTWGGAVSSGNNFQGPATTDLAAPASDQLTMWCFYNPQTAITSTIIGKWASPNGYELSYLASSGNDDLAAQENAQAPIIANIYGTLPAGFSFIWWRAKSASGVTTMRMGQWSGASTQNVTTAATAATLADASTAKFGIGTGAKGSTGSAFVDECGWEAANLSDAALCRICSCGIDGSLCMCSGTTYANSGRNATFCGGCSLALQNCNAATPSGSIP
jgi:hypothetical protein